MKIFGYDDKPVIQFDCRENRKNTFDYTILTKHLHFHENSIIELTSVKRKLDTSKFGKLSDTGVLYLDKSATFPRAKLEGTDYRRCIKKEKADFIIINQKEVEDICNSRKTINIYETVNSLFLTTYITDSCEKYFLTNIEPTAKKVYSGRITEYKPKNQILLEKINVPLISDSDLDTKICQKFPTLTLEDCKQIVSMISSKDASVCELGIKLLGGFNIIKTPFTVKCMLMLNRGWMDTNVVQSVIVKTILNTLQFPIQRIRIGNWMDLIADNSGYIQSDIDLVREIIKPSLENYCKDVLKTTIAAIEKINLTIEINVK